MILGHNVEYTGSVSRLSILVLECSKGGHLEPPYTAKSSSSKSKNLFIVIYMGMFILERVRNAGPTSADIS